MTRRVATAAAKPASDPEAVVDELAIKIQSRILAGEYVGKEWLRQEALASEFGVSRTPVREALSKLEASGSLPSCRTAERRHESSGFDGGGLVVD
jgi:DNA-binding GntR family transcriptional regulator